jgi:hypothetical protein
MTDDEDSGADLQLRYANDIDELSTNDSYAYSGGDYAAPEAAWANGFGSKAARRVGAGATTNIDAGHCTVYRRLRKTVTSKTPDGHLKKTAVRALTGIDLYATSYVPGATIRDAARGTRQPGMIVGTRAENLFYKAAFATGEFGTPNYSNTFFFDSPEEYEAMFQCTISPESKAWWRERRDCELRLRNPQ